MQGTHLETSDPPQAALCAAILLPSCEEATLGRPESDGWASWPRGHLLWRRHARPRGAREGRCSSSRYPRRRLRRRPHHRGSCHLQGYMPPLIDHISLPYRQMLGHPGIKAHCSLKVRVHETDLGPRQHRAWCRSAHALRWSSQALQRGS